MEWVRRYLPCEIAGTVGELGGAAVAYWLTGSMAAAAITATVGASAGYYAAAYTSAVRWAYREYSGRPTATRLVVANLFAVRSVAIEFGPAELIDSIAIRPVAFYLGPQMFSNVRPCSPAWSTPRCATARCGTTSTTGCMAATPT
jgi:hypothetical protein